MANEQAKFLNSRRRFRDSNAIKKQVKIAKDHSYVGQKRIEPHRFNKHHAMDCGNKECYLCGNPRKTHKDKLTAQEHRLFQDLDAVRDRHSNGLEPKE